MIPKKKPKPKPKPEPKSKFQSYKQASEYWGIPIGTLSAWVCKKLIPHHRLGRRMVRFDTKILQEWMAEHKVPVVSDEE